jgi:hypothetical protein
MLKTALEITQQRLHVNKHTLPLSEQLAITARLELHPLALLVSEPHLATERATVPSSLKKLCSPQHILVGEPHFVVPYIFQVQTLVYHKKSLIMF